MVVKIMMMTLANPVRRSAWLEACWPLGWKPVGHSDDSDDNHDDDDDDDDDDDEGDEDGDDEDINYFVATSHMRHVRFHKKSAYHAGLASKDALMLQSLHEGSAGSQCSVAPASLADNSTITALALAKQGHPP